MARVNKNRRTLDRAWFRVSRALGAIMRAGRYADAEVVQRDGETFVRKRRRVYAPLAIALAAPAYTLMGTGTRVLSQKQWETRERELYQVLYGATIKVEQGGSLLLPPLAGQTLAALLDDLNPNHEPAEDDADLSEALAPPEPTTPRSTAVAMTAHATRLRAIQLATVALAELHARGITHADAMAENVLVDMDAGVARWFDFETIHDPDRPMTWRRADDLRALLTSVVLRVPVSRIESTVDLVVQAYGDLEVTRLIAPAFLTVRRRALAFQLGQAPISFGRYREIARLLTD